jgi:hypothetical protein
MSIERRLSAASLSRTAPDPDRKKQPTAILVASAVPRMRFEVLNEPLVTVGQDTNSTDSRALGSGLSEFE